MSEAGAGRQNPGSSSSEMTSWYAWTGRMRGRWRASASTSGQRTCRRLHGVHTADPVGGVVTVEQPCGAVSGGVRPRLYRPFHEIHRYCQR